MAGTKRKAESANDNGAQAPKRSRASAVSATAAADRPRRSTAGTSTVAANVAASTTKSKTNTKTATVKSASKTTKTKPPATQKTKAEKVKKEPKEKAEEDKEEEVDAAPKKPTKTAKPKTSETPAATKHTAAAKKKGPAESEERAPGEIRYWLMKAEPETRMEKGVDVRFSIHDLEARTKPEPWDGVRNPMAQKNMRNMKTGDLAFFYHSNCKIPGIAGLMQIAHEHSIDESAFDEKHPYFDPKSSRDKPRWHVVHVEHLRTLDELVPLRELQKHAKDDGALAGMQVLRMSRLSVSQVSTDEWEYILRELVGLDPKEVKAK